MTLLKVEDLQVRFPTHNGVVDAVKGVSFTLGRERLGLVGESGSGKTAIGRAILRLIRPPGEISANRISLGDSDLLTMSEREFGQVRGRQISMVLQDARYSLNPVLSVGEQISEAFLSHSRISKSDAFIRSLDLLRSVSISNAERVLSAYPHELSGGMAQRIMIAMMVAPQPQILIADEPTSALDVSVQRKVLRLIDDLVKDRGMGLLFISHDLNLVSEYCDRIMVMYRGAIVDECRANELNRAVHPYTQGLLKCMPRFESPVQRLQTLDRDPSWGIGSDSIEKIDHVTS
ncbi:ABC transporter ATP-binding protein [Labrenzia sp. DG1229]|uniref:ABC transporter ATP-binding protein n=1 Tax=Labrenzia sp. DG1229 TaxID=681847 RepID=UPI000AC9ED72|nr:ABC transporter ATP-binding protein [Labrenzia sp. DG1229]